MRPGGLAVTDDLVRIGGPMGRKDSLKATHWTLGRPGNRRPQGREPPDEWMTASMSAPSVLTSKQPQKRASSDIA